MARYTGPKTKKARALGEAIYGPDRYYDRKKYPPGEHGKSRRRQRSDYAVQLQEKQKAKFTYGLLERQFRNLFKEASRAKGVTGDVLLQYLESRLDNVVFRLGIAPTRRAARQFVSHKHIVLNNVVTNIPSVRVKPGDIVGVRPKSQGMEVIHHSVANKSDLRKFPWLEFNPDTITGKFIELPEREQIPENINDQLIVELYSK